MSIIRSLINKTIKSDEPANILILVHDGIFDYDLCLTPHTFYGASNSSMVGWNPITKNKPDNFVELPNEFNIVKNAVTFDLILTNSRDRTYEKALQFSNSLHIPIIICDHTPYDGRQKCINIHTSPTFKNETYSELVEYMVDVQSTDSEKDIDVLICGSFMKEEHHIIEKIQSSVKCIVIGDSPGLSKPVYDEEYVDYFNRAKVYINLSTFNGVSPHLLQAMASKCSILSNDIPSTRNILGDITYIQNVEDVSGQIKELLDGDLESIGNDMQKIAKERFSPKKFIDKWTKLFYRYKDEIYTR